MSPKDKGRNRCTFKNKKQPFRLNFTDKVIYIFCPERSVERSETRSKGEYINLQFCERVAAGDILTFAKS